MFSAQLTLHSISKSYGVDPILKDISFNLNPGERLGLIGPNGCGKTTLLRILAGLEKPDTGSFHFNPPGLRLGHLPQGLAPAPHETIAGFLERMCGDLAKLTAELEAAAACLAADPDQPALQHTYDRLLAQITIAAESAGRAPHMLGALGLGHFPVAAPAAHLSGGQKTRLALAGVLLSAPHLLLLDEPTNHLDLDMLAWLENWLTGSSVGRKTAVLIVSHDRAFLDRTVTGILEIDPLTHALRPYPGNYSAYVEQKLAERQRLSAAYQDQVYEIRRVQQDIHRTKQQALRAGPLTAKGVARKAAAREKKLERYLASDERVEKPAAGWQMKLDFSDKAAASSRAVVTLENLSVGYNGSPLLADLNQQVRYGQRLALTGPNGAGKTTLLRTIAGVLPPLAGSVRLGPSVRPGYMAQEQETLHPEMDAFDTIRSLAAFSETEARAFLHQFLFSGDEVFTPLARLSYGERARLSLACLAARGCSLLLLDEPLNHLDITSRSRFEQALENFDGTITAVTHDRYFIENFATALWELRAGSLNNVIQ